MEPLVFGLTPEEILDMTDEEIEMVAEVHGEYIAEANMEAGLACAMKGWSLDDYMKSFADYVHEVCPHEEAEVQVAALERLMSKGILRPAGL